MGPRRGPPQVVPLVVAVLLAGGLDAAPLLRKDGAHKPGQRRNGGRLQLQQMAADEPAEPDTGPTGQEHAGPDTGPTEHGPGVRGLRKIKKIMQGITQKADEVVEEVQKQIKSTQPLMEQINVMRAQLCWTRPDLWNHLDCLKFLGVKCKEGSTGKGICQHFKEAVETQCEEEESKKLKKVYCKVAKMLHLAPDSPEEEGKELEPQEDQGSERGEEKANSTKEQTEGEPGEASPDRDGDGVRDEDDAFPDDPKETADLDQDGIGDNADPDIDGDNVSNEEDQYPRNGSKWSDDHDGDGIHNEDDVFPWDLKEWGDLDKDGIGDNSDPDVDGDGVLNEHDAHPRDSSIAVSDRDGDGVPDAEDAFPDNEAEWQDSDGDGVGDNADADPHNANCWEAPCEDPSSNQAGRWRSPFDKVRRPLPSQGYDERSPERLVEHGDGSMTRDWRKEWPVIDETERESIRRICKEHPDNVWCKRYARNPWFSR